MQLVIFLSFSRYWSTCMLLLTSRRETNVGSLKSGTKNHVITCRCRLYHKLWLIYLVPDHHYFDGGYGLWVIINITISTRLTSPSGTESQLLALRPLDNSISGLSDFCQIHIYITEISVEIDFFNPNIPIYWYWDQVFKLPHLAPNVHPLLGRKASGQVNIPLLHSCNKQQKGTNHGLKIKLITTGGVLKCGTLAVGRLTFAVGGSSSTAPSNHTIKFSTKQLDRRSVTLNRQLIVCYQTNNSRSERNRSERKNLKE